MGLSNLFQALKGGSGSGNRGHEGIPGHRGGSRSFGSRREGLSDKGDAIADYAEAILSNLPKSHLENISEIVWKETSRNFGSAGGKAGKVGQENKGPINIEIKHPGSTKLISKEDAKDLLLHEIGHRVYDHLPSKEKDNWEKASLQLKIDADKNPFFKKELPYLTEISRSDNKKFAGELFSDTYSLYVRNPNSLRKNLKLRAEAFDRIF